MSISHKFKCIHVHIAKTGGMSIANWLERQDDKTEKIKLLYEDNAKNDKMVLPCALWYKKIIKKSIWDNYFKFSFVRNPYDRLVSAWKHKAPKWDFKDFIESLKNTKSLSIQWHTASQFEAITEKGKLLVDFVGRFEKLNEDIKKVSNLLGIKDFIKLGRLNITVHKRYTEYYTPELIEIVSNIYKKDLEYFNYKYGE